MASFSPVFLTSDEIIRLRNLIDGNQVASGIAFRSLISPAQSDFRRECFIPPSLVTEGILFCEPETGTPLIYDHAARGGYRSPSGMEYSGTEYDRAWASITHNRNANVARRCALAGLLTHDQGMLEKARDLLMRYSEVYLTYPPYGVLSATWGRLFHQALDESVWSLSMLWAAECLWHAEMLSEREITLLRDKLFFPLADLVWGEWYYIHNIRMWHNAAIGCIGLAFGDRSLVRRAIHGERGFRQQLVDGYRWKDGFSCEGSTAYHGYGMMAMLFLAEAMKRNGYEPYHDRHLQSAILAPYRMIQPDNTPPAFGDLVKPKTLPTRIYATAGYRLPDDGEIQAASSLSFQQWEALGCKADFETADWNDTTAYYGRSEVDWLLGWELRQRPGQTRLKKQATFKESGIAILRPEEGACLMLKASAHTGNHDHFDRLSFVWWEKGVCWFDDPGTCYYAHPFHEGWFKHTAAHHTAMVDHARQEKCAARIEEVTDGRIVATVSPYPTSMPDVTMRRELARLPEGWLDTVTVSSDRSRTVDLFFGPNACMEPLPGAGMPVPFTASHLAPLALTETVSLPMPSPPYSLDFTREGQTMRLKFMNYPQGSILIVGKGRSDPQDHQRTRPFVCLRATGKSVTIQTAMQVLPLE